MLLQHLQSTDRPFPVYLSLHWECFFVLPINHTNVKLRSLFCSAGFLFRIKAKHHCQVHTFGFLLGRSLPYLCLCYSPCLGHVFLIGAGQNCSAFLLPVIGWITNNGETGYPAPFINDICYWNTLREFE